VRKIMCALLSILCTGCIVVSESAHTYRETETEETCDVEPYSYAPDYCDTYSDGECCEWYVGDGCYETWCYDYYYCDWYYYSTACYY
jgi:hypothetical protein